MIVLNRMRTKHIWKVLIPFFLLGGVLNVAGLLMFSFYEMHLHYLLALGLTYVVMSPISAIAYWFFVFGKQSPILKSLVRYTGTTLIPLAGNSIALPLLVELANLSPVIAQFGIVLSIAIIMFAVGERYTFAPEKKT